jgi:hypothetical protein
MFRKSSVFLALLITLNLVAQEPLKIQRIDQEPVFDGIPDEAFWKDIPSVPFVQHSPNFGKEPSEHTEVRIAYDDQFIWVSGIMKDSGKPRTYALTRDGGSWADDWFSLNFDTFNDKENNLSFSTTPSGLRFDAAMRDLGIDNINFNISWNTFWDVKTHVTDDGWTAEFRIPLSSLRFQNRNGKTVMGLIVWRKISRLNEVVIFPPIPPEFGEMSIFKVSQAVEIEFEGLHAENPLYLTPYLLAGKGRNHEHNEEETELIVEDEERFEVGFDVRYNLTNNLVLDATVNTDFAQVEADDQEVNLSRFSLFFPEKRNFFMERASSFDMNFGYNNKVFYSRKIGLNEEERIRILGGVRLVGRLGKWDIGLLDMQTEKSEELSSENLGVLRLSRQVFNPNSYLGLITTTRLGSDGTHNIVYGTDGLIKVFNDDYLKFGIAQSLISDLDQEFLSGNTLRVNLVWEKRKQKGLGYKVELSQVGEDYDPGLGFESREGYKSFNAELHYTWFPSETSRMFKHGLTASTWQIFNRITGELESAQHGPKYSMTAKSGFQGFIQPRIIREFVDELIEIDNYTDIPVGTYDYKDVSFMFTTPQSSPFRIMPTVELGEFYDGKRISASTELQWNQSKHLELIATYVYNDVKFKERGQSFKNHIIRFRSKLMFDTRFSLNAFIQYNNANESFGSNIRLRYNPSEGHDLYIVYNQSDVSRDVPIPDLNPSDKYRAFMLKYNYTLKL